MKSLSKTTVILILIASAGIMSGCISSTLETRREAYQIVYVEFDNDDTIWNLQQERLNLPEQGNSDSHEQQDEIFGQRLQLTMLQLSEINPRQVWVADGYSESGYVCGYPTDVEDW